MKIEIKYFGMIAEKVGKSSEIYELTSATTISAAKAVIVEQYPAIKNLIYKIALNQDIVPEESKISADAELAFLPPFAGG